MSDVPEPSLTVDDGRALVLLATGELEPVGRLVDASNATLYCTVADGELSAVCVYKPVQGERPLWDFPDGTLAGREVAAYAVSQALGWGIVPPTLLRDGPFGTGMVQLWVDVDEAVDLSVLVRTDHPDLRRMALFDAVINNADRKGGHLLPVEGGRILGCDHGVSFHVEDKLRTVLWGWRGDLLNDDELTALALLRSRLDGDLADQLHGLISRAEVDALRGRVDRLLRRRRFPQPSPDWPAIPWPAF